jgi:hypothetical protein
MRNAIIIYDAMCTAIADCHRIDEVKDLRDKAMALELYAKQARNTDAERKASEIRLRAERRTGELLKDLPRVTPSDAGKQGGRGNTKSTPNDAECFIPQPAPSPYAQALAGTGISTQTASRYQALANVPTAVFESALRDPEIKPTTTQLIKQVANKPAPAPQIPDEVLLIWGQMRDFEREGFRNKSPESLLDAMTPSMRCDVERIAHSMADFFTAMQEAAHVSA